MNRRNFLKVSAATAAAMVFAPASFAAPLPEPTVAKLPVWRGFNLLEYFNADWKKAFVEKDFEMIADLGFNFVRLPLSYRCWNSGKVEEWTKLDEKALAGVDQAVDFGKKHGIHTNVNLHRAPGYCVNPPNEPLSLWDDEKALEACAFHWAHLASRYKGRPNREVTFNLLNEPKDMPEEKYVKVVQRLAAAIHEVDQDRLIVIDGLKWGGVPVKSLAGVVAQSTRGYQPMRITHHKANWINGSDKWEDPTWPLVEKKNGKEDVWDKARLTKTLAPWKDFAAAGNGVHVGEWGVHNRTPHAVTLAFMKDYLEAFKEARLGWALWNFRGSFGVMDSGRKDVPYEDYKGHKLDRKMLEVVLAG
jgi:endoglucanase